MGYDKNKRPDSGPGRKQTVFAQSSTQLTGVLAPVLKTPGAYSLSSTSTAAAALFTLDSPRPGDIVQAVVGTIASSSQSPLKIKTRQAGETFDGSSGDVISLSSAGCGVTLQALSTSRWGIIGIFGATVSTST